MDLVVFLYITCFRDCSFSLALTTADFEGKVCYKSKQAHDFGLGISGAALGKMRDYSSLITKLNDVYSPVTVNAQGKLLTGKGLSTNLYRSTFTSTAKVRGQDARVCFFPICSLAHFCYSK